MIWHIFKIRRYSYLWVRLHIYINNFCSVRIKFIYVCSISLSKKMCMAEPCRSFWFIFNTTWYHLMLLLKSTNLATYDFCGDLHPQPQTISGRLIGYGSIPYKNLNFCTISKIYILSNRQILERRHVRNLNLEEPNRFLVNLVKLGQIYYGPASKQRDKVVR